VRHQPAEELAELAWLYFVAALAEAPAWAGSDNAKPA
jgi:hypothetical protein